MKRKRKTKNEKKKKKEKENNVATKERAKNTQSMNKNH